MDRDLLRCLLPPLLALGIVVAVSRPLEGTTDDPASAPADVQQIHATPGASGAAQP